jgi:hypothetical protein
MSTGEWGEARTDGVSWSWTQVSANRKPRGFTVGCASVPVLKDSGRCILLSAEDVLCV